METTLRKKTFRFWFPWNADKIEKWLENQAAEGWILERIDDLMTTFYFRKATATDMNYYIEYKNSFRDNSPFSEGSSWSLIGEKCGWKLWGRAAEAITEQYLNKKRLQLKSLKSFLPILIAIGASQPLLLMNSIHRFTENTDPVSFTMLSVLAASASFFIFGISSIVFKINRLKKEIGA